MKITFIQTGGTIDKDYPKTTKGWAFEIASPAVHRILEKINLPFGYDVVELYKKDSQEITNEERKFLLKECNSLTTDKIIITHGTDTMIETGLFLANNTAKLIILTGAMRPERFSNSDAAFNIGTAIGAINLLEKGVFIAMNGLIIPIENAGREEKTGQFIDVRFHYYSIKKKL